MILGNLRTRFPGSHVYLARSGEQWLGLAAYYDAPRSLIPFSTEPQVTRALVRHIAGLHRPIEYMNGSAFTAEPAYDELVALGFAPANDPRQILMEAPLSSEDAIPRCPHEDGARLVRPADGPELALLMRYLRGRTEEELPTQREIEMILINPHRMVIESAGRAATMAATNGIGIRAFQILAVATRPQFRRQGYASSVCAALMRHMFRQGARHAVLFTNVDNHAARSCYEQLGFTVTGSYMVARFAV